MDQQPDKLEKCFERQTAFMEELRLNDVLPEWPVDMTTKPGQRIIKEMISNAIYELAEATAVLKNKMHRLSDDKTLDIDHYKEELGDAFAYLLEVCILSGFTANDLYKEYRRKNEIVFDRLKNGY